MNIVTEGVKAMSAMPKPRFTAAEYLAIERKAEFRSEFCNGEMIAMSGASWAHVLITNNLIIELGSRFKGGPCRAVSHDMRVNSPATGSYTYPDVVILCEKPQLQDEHQDTLLNPRVLIEILSPSTERYDRGWKLRNSQQIKSLMEYVLVTQDQPLCERFVRQPDGSWKLWSAIGLEAELSFDSVPVRVPLTAIYAGVEFPPNPESAQGPPTLEPSPK